MRHNTKASLMQPHKDLHMSLPLILAHDLGISSRVSLSINQAQGHTQAILPSFLGIDGEHRRSVMLCSSQSTAHNLIELLRCRIPEGAAASDSA
jgi:hypothetical protein